jgi:hypothetical protein
MTCGETAAYCCPNTYNTDRDCNGAAIDDEFEELGLSFFLKIAVRHSVN